jgi:nickel/cobalt transporter (NicO) family protein
VYFAFIKLEETRAHRVHYNSNGNGHVHGHSNAHAYGNAHPQGNAHAHGNAHASVTLTPESRHAHTHASVTSHSR